MPVITTDDNRAMSLSIEDIQMLERAMFSKGRAAKFWLSAHADDNEVRELIAIYDRLALGLHRLTCPNEVCNHQ